MKSLKVMFLIAVLLSYIACNNNEPDMTEKCEDHTSGYDIECGCPGLEVGFAGWCINQSQRDLTYYFGEVNFYCITDSIAIGVELSEGILDVSTNSLLPTPSIGFYGDIQFVNQQNVGSNEGCQNIPGFNNTESTYFIVENPDQLVNLPDEITLKLLHKKGPGLFFETLDSTFLILQKDGNRK